MAMDLNNLFNMIPPDKKKRKKGPTPSVNDLLKNLMSGVSRKGASFSALLDRNKSKYVSGEGYYDEVPQSVTDMMNRGGLYNPEYQREMPVPRPDYYLNNIMSNVASRGNAISNMLTPQSKAPATDVTLDKNAVENISPLLAKLMFGGFNQNRPNETPTQADNVTTGGNNKEVNVTPQVNNQTEGQGVDSEVSGVIKRILALKDKEYDIADKYNKFNLFQGVVDKFINDMTASRATGSIKPLSYMPPGATAFMKAPQTDANMADRQTATILRGLMASGATPAMLKSVLSEGMKMKGAIEQSNRQARQQTMQQNIAATADMVNRYNQAYTNTTNANIQMGNQMANKLYDSATKMSYANAQKIGEMLAGLSMNKRSRILQEIELLKSKYLKNNNTSSGDKEKERKKYEPDTVSF